jgi:hypothetical protein
LVDESEFVGKSCKVFFNDLPGHVAWIEGVVITHDLESKFVTIKDKRRREKVGVYAIKISEVVK